MNLIAFSGFKVGLACCHVHPVQKIWKNTYPPVKRRWHYHSRRSSPWFQPKTWKICSANWIISPSKAENKICLKPPPVGKHLHQLTRSFMVTLTGDSTAKHQQVSSSSNGDNHQNFHFQGNTYQSSFARWFTRRSTVKCFFFELRVSTKAMEHLSSQLIGDLSKDPLNHHSPTRKT